MPVLYLSETDSKHVRSSYFEITQIAFNNDISPLFGRRFRGDWEIAGFTRNWFVLFCRDGDEAP